MEKFFKEKTDSDLTEKVKKWWNDNPFQYLIDTHGDQRTSESADWAFFRNVDRKVMKWMPWAHKGYPLLSNLIDYSALKGKKILDIAVGTGWTTEQFVRAGADVTAIDLTPEAVALTKKRFSIFNINSGVKIIEADAQNLPFEKDSFDFVLAWGCLMHMPDTQKAIDEIWRVLKPGGKAAAMMYNKHSLHWWYFIFLSKGMLRAKLLKMTVQELANRFTDGAYEKGNQLTKFYGKNEIRRMFGKFAKCKIRIHDTTTPVDTFPHRRLPLGALLPKQLKEKLMSKLGQTFWIEVEK